MLLTFHLTLRLHFMTWTLFLFQFSWCIKRRENEDVTRFYINFLCHFLAWDVKMWENKNFEECKFLIKFDDFSVNDFVQWNFIEFFTLENCEKKIEKSQPRPGHFQFLSMSATVKSSKQWNSPDLGLDIKHNPT